MRPRISQIICHVSAGFGLGWHVVNISGRIVADHTGKDADVVTFAFFIPEQQSGGVFFTDGPDVGHEMIDKILNVLYPDPVYAQTPYCAPEGDVKAKGSVQ